VSPIAGRAGGIRRQLTRRLSEVDPRSSEARERKLHEFLEETKNAPVAPVPEKANDQHYELPPEFFELCLGEYRKYSCCYWSDGAQTLSEAERRALEITCERARLEDSSWPGSRGRKTAVCSRGRNCTTSR
jgi:cyclopropane-fatty-acyl-phospholipid synthase